MSKKILIIVVFLLFTAAGYFLAFAHTSIPVSKQTCSKKCGNQQKPAPATGFFIVDSFSGIL